MNPYVTKFITELAVHFGKRHDSAHAEEAWLRSMVGALKGYSAGTLKSAAAEIIATRTERTFPLPAECTKICDGVARREKLASGQANAVYESKNAAYSDGRVSFADQLISGQLGKQAAKEGWVLSLHDFCRKHQRLPAGNEVGACKASAKGFDDAYALCVRGDAGPMNAALLKLGDSMLVRRRELADKVLGKAA